MRRWVVWVLVGFLMLPGQAGAVSVLDDEGFLEASAGIAYYFDGGREAGVWTYADAELAITIEEKHDDVERVTWFETHIRCRDGVLPMETYMTGGGQPGALVSPAVFAPETGALFVISDDYFGGRRMTGQHEGVIIRDGVVLADDPVPAGREVGFPPLEIIALFADGTMRTFGANECSAEDYLAMGVTDTLCFGPILLQGGERVGLILDAGYAAYKEPRCAIGMIEAGHYVVLTVLGRTDDSKGVMLPWLADRMEELGAVEAINLDGGATVALSMMGDLISHPVEVTRKDVRGVNTMMGVGRMP